MADIWQTQNIFWNTFGIPAYDDQTASVSISYPHLTYESFDGVMDQQASLSINLWYRSSSWEEIKQKADEIKRALASGELLKYEDGYLWLKMPDSAIFSQPLDSGSDDSMVKRILITVEAESLSA